MKVCRPSAGCWAFQSDLTLAMDFLQNSTPFLCKNHFCSVEVMSLWTPKLLHCAVWPLRWDVAGDRNWGYDVPHVRDLYPGPQFPPQAWIFWWNLSRNSLLRNGTQVNNSIYWNAPKLREYGEGMGSTFKLVKLSFAAYRWSSTLQI